MQSLGKAIRSLRKARGLNQTDLAKLSGISTVTISQIENDLTNPAIGTIETLAEALNTTVPALYLSVPMKTRRTDEGLKKLVGTNVRTRRAYLSLSMGAAAKRVGLTKAYISAVENGRQLPQLKKLLLLSRSLEVQPSWLLELSFNQTRSVAKTTDYIHVRQVGARIRAQRERMGLSILEASNLAGWHSPQWYSLEGNKKDYSIPTLLNVSSVLGVNISEIIDNGY
ncbi:helix-turn-helix domain-containing protein [uncultured Ruegeria sp.]|uniref:helix-turn-helix domain-containing protein n=1 Tax=uncultured Ruegeria sp. TaxID=259304 RepID=UPI002635E554|nr:helix-turn-helix domain-containing protein [uncultured Ruegeria sp.]